MKTFRNALIGLLIVIIAGYFLFADWLIKTIAEEEIGKAYGAEVNIGAVSHSLFPTTITFSDIQLTDPIQPTTNKVAVQQAFADVEFGPLLSKKLIANEVNIDGVAFGTARASAGAVYRQPEPAGNFGFPSLEDVPSVDELLQNSPLKTTAAVTQAQQTVQKHEAILKEQFEALPSKARIDEYKAQIKALQAQDLKDPQAMLQAKNQFDQLKEQIRADKTQLESFTTAVQAAKEDLSAAKTALSQASKEDYQLLQGLVGGDQAALAQITQSLFGEKAAQYTQYITLAIQTLAPMLSGESAAEETPKEIPADGLPNVWIKQARASVLVNGESIASEWRNITDQHALVNGPTEFVIDAAQSALWQVFSTSGQFAVTADGVNAEQQWSIKGINLKDLNLSDSQRMSAQILSALATTTGQLSVINSQLDGTGSIDLAQLSMALTGSDDFTSAVASAMDDISALSMRLNLSGDLQSPNFSLRSDLDRQLMSAIATSFSQDETGKLAELRNKLEAKTADSLGDTSGLLSQLTGWQDQTAGQSATLNELLAAPLNNAVEKKKNELLDKLKGKLGG
ncbi:TIGR03545 family protein [Alteromonas flava]|uniref:TIGR03545 family protein n=1 Tax=Alteromonas flava TaxID=2048003 RepID=UPI0013DC1A50|nr:TIGR03545 family protein [Alteromonas flava]